MVVIFVSCSGETGNKSEPLVSDFGIDIHIQPCNQPWMEGKFWLTFSNTTCTSCNGMSLMNWKQVYRSRWLSLTLNTMHCWSVLSPPKPVECRNNLFLFRQSRSHLCLCAHVLISTHILALLLTIHQVIFWPVDVVWQNEEGTLFHITYRQPPGIVAAVTGSSCSPPSLWLS